jgi:2'-5' RNA ligase
VRAELAPDQKHLRAHVTTLHPRLLSSANLERSTIPQDSLTQIERAACAIVERAAGQLAPIRVSFGEVTTFSPAHPTVYLPVEDGARHLRYLNGVLKSGPLNSPDPWVYVPHLTLATLPDNDAAVSASHRAAEKWHAYRGPCEYLIEELSLVREDAPDGWLDLYSVRLGG